GQNLEAAAGQLGQPPMGSGQAMQLPLTTLGQLDDVKQFRDIVVKVGLGQPARRAKPGTIAPQNGGAAIPGFVDPLPPTGAPSSPFGGTSTPAGSTPAGSTPASNGTIGSVIPGSNLTGSSAGTMPGGSSIPGSDIAGAASASSGPPLPSAAIVRL